MFLLKRSAMSILMHEYDTCDFPTLYLKACSVQYLCTYVTLFQSTPLHFGHQIDHDVENKSKQIFRLVCGNLEIGHLTPVVVQPLTKSFLYPPIILLSMPS